jgi:hypothetical protein
MEKIERLKMKAFLRFLIATSASAISLVLGISALVVVWILFFALLNRLNPNTVTEVTPPPEGELLFFLHYVVFNTWIALLTVAAPIWALVWPPLYLVRSRRPQWKISTTIFVAAFIGGVGGAVECILVFLYYLGFRIPDERQASGPLLFAGICFVIGAIGGALIGAAETLTSKWFKGKNG